jgi:MFS transporter, Spinster family, sphingosine-1-phosphate transporter
MQETDQAQSVQQTNTPQAATYKPISTAYSYYALIILSMLNLLNYVDRSIFGALVPYIEKEFHFTDDQFGTIGSAFTVVYTILSPVYGYFADRRRRTSLISSGIAIWSLATALGGLAQGFWQLFAARTVVGVGEASYATISPGFLSDYFEPRRRGVAFGIFFAAVPVGQALGFFLGGQLGDADMLGWRHTLYLVGIPGLAMALLAHFLREPERGKMDLLADGGPEKTAIHSHGSIGTTGSIVEGYKALAKNYPYVVATLGYSAMTFTFGILLFWGPKLLVTDKHLPANIANVKLGIYMTLGGLLGTVAGGWIGDLFARRLKGGYFLLCGLSAILGAVPLIVVIATRSADLLFPAIFVTAIFLLLGNGPVNAIIVNSVAPGLRSTAMATTILAIHFLGDAISIKLVGTISTWIAERFTAGQPVPGIFGPFAGMLGLTGEESLSVAMLIAPVALLVAGLLFFLGLRSRPAKTGS